MKKLIAAILAVVMVFACFVFAADQSPPGGHASIVTASAAVKAADSAGQSFGKEEMQKVFVRDQHRSLNISLTAHRDRVNSGAGISITKNNSVGQNYRISEQRNEPEHYRSPLASGFDGFGFDNQPRGKI